MKFEAIKPEVPLEEDTVPKSESLTEAEKQEKLSLIEELENHIKVIESTRDGLKALIAEAEKSKDWSKVLVVKKLLQDNLSQAKTIQRKLEGKDTELNIITEYVYKNEKGKEVKETIKLDFETEISSTVSLYEKHGIEIPVDFEEQVKLIWEDNINAIKEGMMEKGFNKVLFIPEKLPSLKDLDEKMTEGYEKEKGNKTYWGEKADSITEVVRTGARIVLLHDATDLTVQPELKKTLGKKYGGEKEDGKDNRAQDFLDQGETLTVSEYFILQRDIFEKTGIHLDSKAPDGNIYWTWLPGSRVGSEVVHACFSPGLGQVFVIADGPGSSGSYIGCRLSRCFYKK
jgi:hypothetical protein